MRCVDRSWRGILRRRWLWQRRLICSLLESLSDDHAWLVLSAMRKKFMRRVRGAADKDAVEVTHFAPIQVTDHVPPRSVARDVVNAKLQSRILSAVEVVQAAKLHQEMPPEQQAIMLRAGEQGTGTTWTAMHKSSTDLTANAQWRMATALRLGFPMLTGALRKGNDGDMCEHSLAKHPFHSPDRIVRSCAHCMLLSEAG